MSWSTTAATTFVPNLTLYHEYERDDDLEHDYQREELNLVYAICEIFVAILAVIGNALVILVFRKERRLRRRTNYYIVSLAVADFLVGLLGIPSAIMASIGWPTNLYACLFTVSLLVVLCTISIFCLVAVSVDRYWAILHPMGYSRNVRTKTALVIISICWFTGTVIGFLPLMGWHKGPTEHGRCFFLGVMDYNYLVFLYFGTIITPALLLAIFYAHIYHVVLKQLRRIVTINPYNGNGNASTGGGGGSGGTMLRMLGAAQKREVKATQNLSIIVLFFMICWIPLYTINCILAFCKDCKINSTFMLSCIILSHLNSAGNPLLYAYHLRDFRLALKLFICNILHIRQPPPTTNNFVINNNFSHYRLRSLREAHSTMSLSTRNRLINENATCKPRAHTLPSNARYTAAAAVTTATAVAASTNWRLSGIVETDLNQPDDDDVFLDTVPITQNNQSQTNLNTPSFDHANAPRNLFLVEVEFRSQTERGCTGDFIHSPAKSIKLSPFKVVGEMLKNNNSSSGIKAIRSCSLSDDMANARQQKIVAENHSCT